MRELKLVEKYKGSLLLRFAVIVLAVFVVVSLIAQQRQIAEKREDLQTLQAQLATQNVKNEELQESLKDEEGLRDYAEKKAREELNYAKPGERVFVDAGANDYLAKPFHLAELEARIRSLTLRQFTQQDVLLSCGGLTFDTRSRTATVNGQTLTLTRKETGILEYLMVHQGRPVSQEELMDHVWDNSVDSFSNSIRVHISALRKKLRAVLGYDPIRNRIGEGYLMGGEEE